MKKVLPLIFILQFISCDEFLEDCIFFVSKPNLRTERISEGRVGIEYYQVIVGEVRNEFGHYFYSFHVENLPDGIRSFEVENKLILQGVPNEAGVFSVEITLSVEEDCYDSEDDDEFDCDNLCFSNDTDSKVYSLVIND
ncbi:hypothetical protein [Aquimarina algicola]|uniref:DUF4249 family protein n=1 Tax=Aquimarina algicola TaxID=2589995 RepID=A0A504J7H7_9FLAO|nr:hypothetical protein [Aquimarina algicola]TPN86816.1 hypothetical protein FHK87_04215 [Aquimarina algicola]